MNLILNLVLPFTSHEDLVPHPIKMGGGLIQVFHCGVAKMET